jgi:CRP/FNR family transcriptional regulator, nitrogen fixation regulation protein
MLMRTQQSSARPYIGHRTEHRPQPQSRATPPVIDFIGAMKLTGAPVGFSRNEVIYAEHRPADYVYKVISGSVRVCKVLNDGRRRIEAFYLPGDVFGLEMDNEHHFSAEAIADSTILVVKRSALMSLAHADGDVARRLWTFTARELRRMQEHVLLLTKTAQERVASFLLDLSKRLAAVEELDVPMSRQDIADYLGLTIETISRTLTQLEAQAAIALPTSRRIVLCNRGALTRLNA